MTTTENLKNNPFKSPENEFSFRELVIKSSNYIPLFVIFLIISFTIAVVYLRYQVPVYSASIKLLIKDANRRGSQSTTVSDQVLPDLFFTSKTNLANEIEILKSQRIMQRVVDHQQLNTLYYSVGNVNTIELFDPNHKNGFLQFSAIKDSSRSYGITIQVGDNNKIYKIDGETKTEIANHTPIVTPDFTYVLNIQNPATWKHDYKYEALWIPTAAMAGGLAGSLSIAPLNKDATILSISTASQVPAKSQLLLNSLVDEYNSYNIEMNNTVANNTIKFIDDRLLGISSELNDVETGLKNFKEQNNAYNIEAQSSQELSTVKDLQDKLNTQELQMSVANMVSNYVNNPTRRFQLVPSNLGIEDPTLSALVVSYNEGVLKREELLKTLGDKNTQILTLEAQLDDLRGRIIESINNVKQVYNDAYTVANNQYKQALSNIGSVPDKEKRLLEIERQQGIKEKLYLFLLQKREESLVSRAASIGKSEPIDPASSGGPINIRNYNIYMMALFAGLGIPFLIVYLMDLFNDRVTTKQEIVKYTDAPIIGEISHYKDSERKVVADTTRGMLPEQFRLLRTNLRYFLPKENRGSCILITSTVPGEGKTFISVNLAAVLAISGKKTVVLEFDMRRPKLGEALNVKGDTADLPTFLAGDLNPKDIIQKVNDKDNLFTITTTFIPPNPAELLLTERLAALFTYLKANFDYIVVDTPPLGIVSDAKILAEHADLSLYVLRQRFTQRKQIKAVNEIYHDKKLPNLALVVNDVKLKGIYSYYGYGYYGGASDYGYDYSFGYGYDGYGRKQDKKNWLQRLLPFKR